MCIWDMLQFQNCHRTALSKGNILFIVPTQLFCIFKEILKRDLMHSATLPSDNRPQGTGQIQTHSSCTFSCKLLGLHLSARRNGQVTQVTHQTRRFLLQGPRGSPLAFRSQEPQHLTEKLKAEHRNRWRTCFFILHYQSGFLRNTSTIEHILGWKYLKRDLNSTWLRASHSYMGQLQHCYHLKKYISSHP